MKNILFLILLFALPCLAQTEVNSFISGTNEGVTYYLPDTRIEVTIEATCITKTPGEFNRYAERYLRINNAISKAETFWEMGSVKVTESGKPNPEKMYTIKLANGSSASNIHIDANGIIETINVQPEKATIEVPSKRKVSETLSDASRYMTGEMLQATSTAKLAELTAKEIYTIRESKLAITRGQSENMPKDGLSMQLILDELNKQEKVLTEMFTGRTDTVHHEFKYTLVPTEQCDTTKAVLFRFSRKLGVLNKEDLAGSPIYYSLKDLKSIKFPTPEETEKKKILKKEGICYNVPGKAIFEIYTQSRTLYSNEVSLAQLGTTEILSKSLFNKDKRTKVRFSTSTGAILSIEQ